jgi:phage-related protein
LARLQAVFCRLPDGSEPVDEYIDQLPPRQQAVIDLQIARLNLLAPEDPPLPFPHSSQVDGELRELRCHYGSQLYRILYRRSENLLILLHMSPKDRGKIPQSAIDVANVR